MKNSASRSHTCRSVPDCTGSVIPGSKSRCNLGGCRSTNCCHHFWCRSSPRSSATASSRMPRSAGSAPAKYPAWTVPPAGSHSASTQCPGQVRVNASAAVVRSEEHTSELQSRENLVCRLLLEKKKQLQQPVVT